MPGAFFHFNLSLPGILCASLSGIMIQRNMELTSNVTLCHRKHIPEMYPGASRENGGLPGKVHVQISPNQFLDSKPQTVGGES